MVCCKSHEIFVQDLTVGFHWGRRARGGRMDDLLLNRNALDGLVGGYVMQLGQREAGGIGTRIPLTHACLFYNLKLEPLENRFHLHLNETSLSPPDDHVGCQRITSSESLSLSTVAHTEPLPGCQRQTAFAADPTRSGHEGLGSHASVTTNAFLLPMMPCNA